MGFWENWNKIRDLARRVTALEEGGGGGGLPSVTSADNGDILKVVSGAWAKAEPSAGVGVTLLWRNPSEFLAFEGQTITLDLSDYDAVIVTFKSMSSTGVDGAVFIPVGLPVDSSFVGLDFSNQRMLKRTIKPTDTGVVFGDCSASVTYTESATSTTDNAYMIPSNIYGINGIVRPT